jgi:hypothetical protein
VLARQSASSLLYSIDNGWAGAELAIGHENGVLTGQLVIFGSGLPVVACIESPMIPG